MAELVEQSIHQRIAAMDLPTASRPWTPTWEPIRIPMTFEEFLDAPFPHNRWEFVDGEAVEMPGVDYAHTLVHGWLHVLLYSWTEQERLGQVLLAGYTLPTENRARGREPDLMFVKAGHEDRCQPKNLEGPADACVEVISPGTRGTDRRHKAREYARKGVSEYWIIDPRRKIADFLVLEADHYVMGDVSDDGIFHSTVIAGVWIDPLWLWDRPPVRDVLERWSKPSSAGTSL